MGIEDQSTQAYQTIGQPPSAPQLNAAYQPYQQQGMMGQAQQTQQTQQGPMLAQMGGLFGAAQGMIDQRQAQAAPAAFQQWMSEAKAREAQMPGSTMFAPAMSQTDMMARPHPVEANPMPWSPAQPPKQDDMYKPQLGAYASSLHKIADELKQAGGGAGNGTAQIGKFGSGMGVLSQMQSQLGKPAMGALSGIGQLGGGLSGGINMFGGGQQTPAQMSSVYTPMQQQAMMGPMQGMAGMLGRAMKEGGEVGEEEAEGGLAAAAKELAAKGRNGDTELLHVTKDEIRGLLAAAKEQGIEMKRNPHTGLYEASWLSKAAKKIKNKVGPILTKVRDVAQSAAVLVANKYIPGSSMLTAGLTSKGSQKLLNSGIGKALQLGTSLGGGGGLSGLKEGIKSAFSGGGSGILGGLKNLGSNIMGGTKNLIGKGIAGLKNLGGGIKNFLSSPLQGIKNLGGKAWNYLKEKGGDLKEGIGNALSNAFEGGGGEGAEGGEGGGGGGTGGSGGSGKGKNLGALADAAAALYAAQHPFKDPREAAGLTELPKVQIPNYEVKQVPNPNYGQPGEPFYLSQSVTPTTPPVQAAGGGLMGVSNQMVAQRNPSYAQGGNVYEYAAGGKLLEGPGDGMSDSIPAEIRGKKVQKALLADGEFVIPADVVSGLGNGSTKAGSKVLYSMMDRVREARTGTTEQGKQIDPNKFVPA